MASACEDHFSKFCNREGDSKRHGAYPLLLRAPCYARHPPANCPDDDRGRDNRPFGRIFRFWPWGFQKTAPGGVVSAPGRSRRRKRPFKPSRPHALARRGRTHRAPAARPKHCASRQVKPLRSDHAAAAHLPEITSRTSPPERQRSATHGDAPRLRCLGRRKVP